MTDIALTVAEAEPHEGGVRALLRGKRAIFGLSVIGFFLFLAVFGSAIAPYNPRAFSTAVIEPPKVNKTVNLSGPRFGMTALGQGVVDELQRRSITVGPNI